MELFGLGWVLRHIGYFGCLAWLFVMAIGGAILGLRYARQNELLSEKDRELQINVVKYAIFLWCVWLLTFGVQYWMFNGFGWGLWFAILAAIGSFILSMFISADATCCLANRDVEAKGWTLIIASCIVALTVVLMWGSDRGLISLTKQERASYYENLLTKEGEKYEGVFLSLEAIKIKPHPYFYAIANLRLQKRDEAAKHFKAYAESFPNEKKMVWIAFSDFFNNDFWSAEKFFTAAGQDHYAIWSKFRNNQLTSSDLKHFIGSHSIGNDELIFFSKMQDVVVSTETLRNDLKEVKTSENTKLLEELRSLKQMVQDLKRVQDAKSQDRGQNESVSATSASIAESDRITKLRDELNVEIEKRVIEFAVKQAPTLPIPTMRDFASSPRYIINNLTVASAFPFFLLCIFGINAIWREKDDAIKEFFKTLLGSIGLSSRISKFGWHSKFARTIAARLAKMEPEDEKGLFNEEIKRIHAAVFPVDVLIGLWYHFKAQRIIVVKHIDAQEREDLLFIHNAIRKLSGKLIPHGDEQALSIITALRERANTGLQNYRKDQLKFLPARDELLSVQKELVTLGDILDAFGEKPDLTNYHLLGLEPKRGVSDTEVKRAYRSVMSAVHPDHNPNNMFVENLAKLVIGAYAILGNPNRRAVYETTIRL